MKYSAPTYPVMRIKMFSEKYSIKLITDDNQVSATVVSAVDEVVFKECYMFIQLLEESGKL